MKTMQKLFLVIIMLGLVAWAVTDVAWAQSRARNGGGTSGTGFQYVIKYICGFTTIVGLDVDLAPGFYLTDVNIHNPNDKIVKFRKKIALDGFENEHHGLQTSPVDVVLGPDEALEINCRDIVSLIIGENPNIINFQGLSLTSAGSVAGQQVGINAFIAGYVVLYSKEKLDVAAIYTACNALGAGGLGVSAQQFCPISTIQVDELIPYDGVPPPTVFVKGLSVNSAGVNLSIEPFSEVGYDGAQLLIYDASGRQLHDSGFIGGTQLSWKPETTQGRPLANGVYLYVVGVRDALGNIAYKAGKFALIR